jgi:hypothetical protein
MIPLTGANKIILELKKVNSKMAILSFASSPFIRKMVKEILRMISPK